MFNAKFYAKRIFSGNYAEIWVVREVSGYIYRVYRHEEAGTAYDFKSKDDALKCAKRQRITGGDHA